MRSNIQTQQLCENNEQTVSKNSEASSSERGRGQTDNCETEQKVTADFTIYILALVKNVTEIINSKMIFMHQ